jgi:hypothetical protein
MSRRTQPAACECGQVLFEVADRKPGELLNCPWCDRQYKFLGEERLELLSKKDGSDKPKKIEHKEPDGKKIERKSARKEASEAVREHAPVTTAKEPSSHSQRQRTAVDGNRSKEIPGGLFPMLGFIVGFNALALIGLAFLLPRQPDGTRQLLSTYVINKKAFWPEILALLAGHSVGFVAWAYYVHRLRLQRRRAMGPAVPMEGKSPERPPSKPV